MDEYILLHMLSSMLMFSSRAAMKKFDMGGQSNKIFYLRFRTELLDRLFSISIFTEEFIAQSTICQFQRIHT